MASHIRFQTFSLPSDASTPEPSATEFTLAPHVPSDIWRKPPSLDVFNAPIIYKSVPVSKFKRVRATVSAKWKTLYDQGGLVFVLPANSAGENQRKWVKSGVEFVEGKPFVSTVAADRWADWSLAKLEGAADQVTIEFERREKDETLWVYLVGEGGAREPLREVTWPLAQLEGDGECWVGVYSATPTEDRTENLVASFKNFELELLE